MRVFWGSAMGVVCSAGVVLAQVQMSASKTGAEVTLAFRPSSKPIAVETGRPYAATVISERTLANGTRMVDHPIRMYRDAQGRTRTEQLQTNHWLKEPFLKIEIVDPVSGSYTLLDTEHRVAHRLAVQTVARAADSEARTPCAPFADPQNNKATNGTTTVIEPIGDQTVEGVVFCGTKTTITYPVGTYMRNDRPVQITHELWTPWDDGLPFYLRKDTDLLGEHKLRWLEDVSFDEPVSSLFRAPGDYHVVEESGAFSLAMPAYTPAKSPQTKIAVTALTDMPFSAEVVSHGTLPDGATLPERSRMLLYRDGTGRTGTAIRVRGQMVPSGITDVVAGYLYMIDRVKRLAHRMPIKVTFQPASSAVMPDARQTSHHPVRDGILATDEWLGTQMIDGFATYGQRTTLDYPPGTFGGNDRPLTLVFETWTSPILGRALRSRNSSPVTGDWTSTIRNLHFGEPDSSLFRVPTGYQIVDGGIASQQ